MVFCLGLVKKQLPKTHDMYIFHQKEYIFREFALSSVTKLFLYSLRLWNGRIGRV